MMSPKHPDGYYQGPGALKLVYVCVVRPPPTGRRSVKKRCQATLISTYATLLLFVHFFTVTMVYLLEIRLFNLIPTIAS